MTSVDGSQREPAFIVVCGMPERIDRKQYAYTQGMNLQTAVPLDAQGVFNTILSTSMINTMRHWLSAASTYPTALSVDTRADQGHR